MEPPTQAPAQSDAGGARQVVFPIEVDTVLSNPGMGWVISEDVIQGFADLGRSGTFPGVDVVTMLSTWSELEPAPGVYDWACMDAAITYWVAQGKRIAFKVSTEAFPSESFGHYEKGTPDWLFDDLGVPFQVVEVGTPTLTMRVVDNTHPVYLERLRVFLDAFAGRYREHPALDYVDLRCYGLWGEMHSGWTYPTVEHRRAAIIPLFQQWVDAWAGHTVLMLSNSHEWMGWPRDHAPRYADYDDYVELSAFDVARGLEGVSLRRDGIPEAMTDHEAALLRDFFHDKAVPLAAEFCSPFESYVKTGSVELALDFALSLPFNFLNLVGWEIAGGAGDYYEQYLHEVIRGARRLGYRFVLTRADWPKAAAPGSTIEVVHEWRNRGVGRLAQELSLEFQLVTADGRVAHSHEDPAAALHAMVGDRVHGRSTTMPLPVDLAPGSYRLRVAAVAQPGSPAISLANAGVDPDGYLLLGDLAVGADPAPTPVVAVHATALDRVAGVVETIGSQSVRTVTPSVLRYVLTGPATPSSIALTADLGGGPAPEVFANGRPVETQVWGTPDGNVLVLAPIEPTTGTTLLELRCSDGVTLRGLRQIPAPVATHLGADQHADRSEAWDGVGPALTSTAQGAWLDYQAVSTEPGEQWLSVASSGGRVAVLVNGELKGDAPASSGSPLAIRLRAGANTIRLRASAPGTTVRALSLTRTTL